MIPFSLHLTATLLKTYVVQFVLPITLCLAIKKKSQGILKGKNHRLKKLSKHLNKSQIWQECGIIRPEIKKNVINMLTALKNTVDHVQRQMSNISKQMEILESNRDRNNISKMNAFDGLVNRLGMAEESLSLRM